MRITRTRTPQASHLPTLLRGACTLALHATATWPAEHTCIPHTHHGFPTFQASTSRSTSTTRASSAAPPSAPTCWSARAWWPSTTQNATTTSSTRFGWGVGEGQLRSGQEAGLGKGRCPWACGACGPGGGAMLCACMEGNVEACAAPWRQGRHPLTIIIQRPPCPALVHTSCAAPGCLPTLHHCHHHCHHHHYLWQLCDGASAEQRELWRLQPAQAYRYLNQSTCYQLPGADNAEEFKVGCRGYGARRVVPLVLWMCCAVGWAGWKLGRVCGLALCMPDGNVHWNVHWAPAPPWGCMGQPV